MIIEYSNDYLAHHGILGQKWGVRRYQNLDGSLTSLGRIHYGVWKHKNNGLVKVSNFNSNDNPYDHSTGENTLKEERRRAVKAGVIGGGLIGALTAYSIGQGISPYNSDETNAKLMLASLASIPISMVVGTGIGLISAGKKTVQERIAKSNVQAVHANNISSGKVDSKTGFYMKQDREYSREEDVKSVNPGFKSFSEDAHNNCMLCSLTYDIRKKGYAVSAKGAGDGFTTEDVKRWYKDPVIFSKDISSELDTYYPDRNKHFKRKQSEMLRDIETELKNEPGSRGFLGISAYLTDDNGRIGDTFGHAIAYEVNNSGRVDLIDAQRNEIYENGFHNKKYRDYLNNWYYVDHVRLDNLEIIPDHIKEVSES